jgi:hypothetical protein
VRELPLEPIEELVVAFLPPTAPLPLSAAPEPLNTLLPEDVAQPAAMTSPIPRLTASIEGNKGKRFTMFSGGEVRQSATPLGSFPGILVDAEGARNCNFELSL